jgi:hypothetical protein
LNLSEVFYYYTLVQYSNITPDNGYLFILYLLYYRLLTILFTFFHSFFHSKVVPEYIYVNYWYFSLLLRNDNSPGTFYNKPRLLVLIASIVLSLSVVPFILPHLFHQHMIYHILIHLVALIISQFLAVVSIMAYLKCKTSRIFFMTLGFITLVIAEYVYLLNSTEDIHSLFITQANIETSHLILLIMIIFFGISFLKSPQAR